MKPTKYTEALMAQPIPPVPKAKYEMKLVTKRKYPWGEYTERCDVLVYTATYEKPADLLTVTVYRPDGTFFARIFQRKKTWFIQEHDDDKPHEYEINNWRSVVSFPEQKADVTIINCLYDWGAGHASVNGLEGLEKYQRKLRSDAVEARYDRIRKSIDNDMIEIREELPKKVKEWVNQVPMKFSRYIFYSPKHGAKPQHGTCSHCNHDVMVKNPRHRKPGICPYCHSHVTFIADGIFARSNGFNDHAYFSYFQPTRAGFCVRIFYVRYEYSRNQTLNCVHTEFLYREENRMFYESNGLFQRAKGYEWGDFKNTGTFDWCRADNWNIGEVHVYHGNLKDIFLRNPLYQYCQIPQIAKMCGKLPPERLFSEPRRYPWMEYLVKLKLFRLVSGIVTKEYGWRDAVNREGRNLKEILKIGKEDIPALQRLNPDSELLLLYRDVKEICGPLTENDLKALEWSRSLSRPRAFTDVLMPEITPLKASGYIERQHQQRESKRKESDYSYSSKDSRKLDTLRDWRDYLGECKKLGYDMRDEQILFPRDLLAAHERTSTAVEVKENHEANEKTIARAGLLEKQFGFEADGLLIRAPRNIAEIIIEGKRQHHCVGGYAKQHAAGKTTILFLRRAEQPDTPFYTMEVGKGGQIIQCRGDHNCDRTKQVNKFLEKWDRWKKDKKKIREKVPA